MKWRWHGLPVWVLIVLLAGSDASAVGKVRPANGRPQVNDGGFERQPPPTQTTFSFVAFGDTRTNHAAHAQVVSSIVSLAPDFVLHTGDMVENGRAPDQWTTFFSIEGNLMRQAPWYGCWAITSGTARSILRRFIAGQ